MHRKEVSRTIQSFTMQVSIYEGFECTQRGSLREIMRSLFGLISVALEKQYAGRQTINKQNEESNGSENL